MNVSVIECNGSFSLSASTARIFVNAGALGNREREIVASASSLERFEAPAGYSVWKISDDLGRSCLWDQDARCFVG